MDVTDSDEEKKEIPMPKFRIRFSDMSKQQYENAIRIADAANQKHKLDKDVCTEIKLMIDKDSVLSGKFKRFPPISIDPY